jgi:hypothetical protein
MAGLGVAPHVADKILNHQSGTISGVAAVYQRHQFLAERKEALEKMGSARRVYRVGGSAAGVAERGMSRLVPIGHAELDRNEDVLQRR